MKKFRSWFVVDCYIDVEIQANSKEEAEEYLKQYCGQKSRHLHGDERITITNEDGFGEYIKEKIGDVSEVDE